MNPFDHDTMRLHVDEYSLGTLAVDREEHVEAHLRHCADCRERARVLMQTVGRFEAAAPAARPPADLAAGVIDTVRAGSERVARAPAPHRRGRWSAVRRWAPVAAAVPVAALAALTISLATQLQDARSDMELLQRQVVDYGARPDLPVLNGATVSQFETDAPFSSASAQVALQDDGGVIVIRNAPAPPQGHVWQVWQVDTSNRMTSLGVIDRAERVIFMPLQDIDRKHLKRIIITTEDGEGSDAPSSEQVAESGV